MCMHIVEQYIVTLIRHRHAAAVMGSNIYVFGGFDNDVIFPSFYVLDTINLQWKEIPVSGDWPYARHSHAMVASDSQIFMFGGYDGRKALGDLYSFDVQMGQGKKGITAGRNRHARFSHSIFVYKNYLGVLGGCPVTQHYQELALLDLKRCTWKHVTLNSVGKDLFVRSTSNVVGDDLVIVGGGASCYAFGTKFSEPAKVSLLHLIHSHDDFVPFENQRQHMIGQNGVMKGNEVENSQGFLLEHIPNISENESICFNDNLLHINGQSQMIPLHCVLQLEKKYAKQGKGILKKFGWLDLGRKAYSEEGGVHICFPVCKELFAVFHERSSYSGDDAIDRENEIPLNNLSCSEALTFLHEYGAILLEDKVVETKKAAMSPLKVMTEAVTSLIEANCCQSNSVSCCQENGDSSFCQSQVPVDNKMIPDIVEIETNLSPDNNKSNGAVISRINSGKGSSRKFHTMTAWFDGWEQEDTYAALAVLCSAASVAIAYNCYKHLA